MAQFTLPPELHLRPQRDGDHGFLAGLFASTCEDLRRIDAAPEFVEELIEMQFRAQREGYGAQFPNAMYFIVEWQDQPVGRAAVDFGANEIRLIDLAFLPAARGKGLGANVIRALQMAAGKAGAPLTLTVAQNNPRAAQLYAGLGFHLEAHSPTHALLAWYPQAA